MNPREGLTWTLKYRGIAVGTFLVGGAITAVGVYLGFAEAIGTIASDPLNPGDAFANSNPLVAIAFALVGLFVWQIGKTYGLFVTLPRATGEQAAEEFDTERVKSEILEVLDERLSEMEIELEQTNRTVQELKRAEHAAEFDEGDLLSAGSDAGAESTSSNTGTAATPDGTSGATESSAVAESSSVESSSVESSSVESPGTTESSETNDESNGRSARRSGDRSDGERGGTAPDSTEDDDPLA